MLTHFVLQKSIMGAKRLTGEDIAVYSADGRLLVSTTGEGERYSSVVEEFCLSQAESQVAFQKAFFKVLESGRAEYVLVCDDTESAKAIAGLTAFQLAQLSVAYREKFDKEDFIKNLLLDNLLLADIYNRAARLSIETNLRRVVLLIKFFTDIDYEQMGRIREYTQVDKDDFVCNLSEDTIVIVKDLRPFQEEEFIEEYAHRIIEAFPEYLRDSIRISFGKIVEEIRYVSSSYKEAIMAMDVGQIFFKSRQVVSYSLLGIGRLVYQLPLPLCKMFIKEIFADKSPDSFDEEMLTTIDKFFENSLNVSETSRQLFIHRNTLVYRLDKLEKSTGLDLRTFEDAITFKIAMMVVEYMKFMEG